MTVDDAIPGDIYVDEKGVLWRCMATCNDPTATFEAVEGYTLGRANYNQLAGAQQTGLGGLEPPPTIHKDKKTGAVRSLMFQGWKRIFRKD